MIEMEQRSVEWHQFRAKRIGASDAPIICGLSPWKSSLQLWMEKTGKIQQPDNSSNFAIQKGIRLEPVVCGMASIMLDRDFIPATHTHHQKQYLMASLDCWDGDYREAGEIKVGGQKDHEKLPKRDGESTPGNILIPRKYYAQVQQQIYVLDLEYEHYISYFVPKGGDEMRGDLRIVKVWRDQLFLDRYLPLAEIFYDCLVENRPPEATKLEV